ncbi:beta strand repeat-containing protein [Flavobacterium sp. N1994]|uniref:beta strand repeat-containing protein n=1 Tax=Flavobacterium sp. N1994 TaxID=2986827 RepID=UPI0022228BD9|nr:fibronectin type III domain-containing protein [Flavobacterium sp. N1994]
MKKIYVILVLVLFLPVCFYSQTTVTLTSPGTSSFTVPAGVTSLTVECWGAGGSGGGTAGNATASGGGGGGGGYSKNTVAVVSGSSINYTIGAGGTGTTANGANGGATTFSTVAANGGFGGMQGNSNSGVGGAGGTGTTFNGGKGANGILSNSGGGGAGSAGSASNGNSATNGTGANAVTNGAAGGNGGVGYIFNFLGLLINVGNDGLTGANPGGGGGGGDNGDFGFFGFYYLGGDGGDGQIKITYNCAAFSLTSTVAASVNVCAGNSSIITLNATAIGLPIGLYAVDYEIQGVPQTAAVMNVTTAGTGTFIANGFTTVGTRTVKITRITSQSCYSDIITNNLTTVTVNSSLSAPTALAGSGATCTQITANWSAISGASYYELDVATDSGFTSFVPGYNALNVGNVVTSNITGLTAGVTYYYRVRVFNGTCISTNSGTITYATTLAPGAPTLNAVTNNTCSQFTINWTAGTGTTNSYTIEWSTAASNFATILGTATGITALTYTITGLTNGVQYKYRIRAVNGCGSSANVTSGSITTSGAAPGIPTLNAVTNNTCTQFTINWAAGTGTTNSYTIEWSTAASNFATILGTASGVAALTYTITGLTNGVQYKYRIRAVNGCGSSANVTSGTITTSGAAPGIPTLNAVTGITCTQFTVNWAAGTGTTNSYTIEWSTAASNFATILGTASGVTALTYTITGVTSATQYKYRIRAVNGCGTSANVTSGNVTTASSPTTPTISTVDSIPFCQTDGATLTSSAGTTYLWSTGETTPSIFVTTAGSYTVQITNASGCQSNSSSATVVTVQGLPTAAAGGSQAICSTSTATVSGATATNGTILWTHNGTGTLSNATTLTPTYTPAIGDIGTTVKLTMTVTSNNTCAPQIATATYTVGVTAMPVQPTLGTVTQPTCAVATGSFSIANYDASYTYAVTPATGVTIAGSVITAPAGTYTVKATSGTCTSVASASATVNTQPATPVQPTLGAVTQPTCSVATGSFSITNYNASYTYAVSPSTGVSISGATITAPAGTYTVTATLGTCTSVASASTTVNAQSATPVQPTLGAVTQPTCAVATGSFSITNYNASYTYAVTPATGVTISGSLITAPAGTYTVKATVGTCTSVASASATVNTQPATPVQPTLGAVTQPTCSVATGSFSITNYNASYTYAVSPSTGVSISGATITAPAGTYTVTATLGTCTSVASASTTVNAQPATPVQPTLGAVTQPTCAVATGSFSITNYNASYTYAVTPATGVTIAGSVITAPAGTYTVKATVGTCTSLASASATVNGQPTNTWNGSWSTGLAPTSTEKIVFAANYNSSSDLIGCSCQVNSGVTVNINSGHTLTVLNSVTVNSGGTLRFNDKASLVQTNDAAVNSGTITYERETTPLKQYDYTYWSSPVASAPLSQLATNSLFYNFSPTINNWVYQTGATTMAQGVGYIGRAPSGLTYSPTQIVETSFTGVPNNGVITTPIVKSTGTYNLIGNPYPSAIDADLFITANTAVTNGTLYLWTHNTAITNNVYTANDYAKYNYTGGVGTLPAPSGGSRPMGKIAAGQGFFIEAKTSLANGTYSATFNNAMRLAGNNTQFFKNGTASTTTNSISEGLERHRVWLSLRSALGAYNQMLVGYVEGATNDYDSLFDGKTFAVGNSVSMYTMNGADNLAIQGKSLPFSATDSIPIGYTTTINGELSIHLDDFDGVFTSQNIYLLDKTTNTVNNLKTGPYTFVTTSGTFNNRFELQFTAQALGITTPTITDKDIKIISENQGLEVISPALAITKVEVFDILGKVVLTKNNLNTNVFQTNSLNVAPQILLVKVTLDDHYVFTKKTLID